MSTLVKPKRSIDGSLGGNSYLSEGIRPGGEAPSRWAIYVIFRAKIAILTLYGSHFVSF